MLYSITKETVNASKKPTFITAGIKENIYLKNVIYDTVTDKNIEFLSFNFENENGDKFTHTEFPVYMSKPLEVMSAEEKERFYGDLEAKMSRIKQIVEVFKDNFIIETDTFKNLAEAVIKFLGNSYENKAVRVKIVYNNKGWTTFPNKKWQAKHTFIESMDVAAELTRIQKVPGDVFERPIRPDVEKIDNNPIEVGNVPTNSIEDKDEIPF